MITYPFLCDECEHIVEVKASIKSEVEKPICPYCNVVMRRQFKVVMTSIPRRRCGNAKNGYNSEITDIINKTE